jgi:hypothetical protein
MVSIYSHSVTQVCTFHPFKMHLYLFIILCFCIVTAADRKVEKCTVPKWNASHAQYVQEICLKGNETHIGWCPNLFKMK